MCLLSPCVLSLVQLVQAVESVAKEVDGVDAVADIRSRSMGGSALVDLAIQVDPMLSASGAHRLAEEVRLRVISEGSERADSPISEVLVHVDTAPHDATCPLQSAVSSGARSHTEVEEDVRDQLLRLPQINAVTRVQVFYLPSGLEVVAQCDMPEELSVAQMRTVASKGRAMLLETSTDLSEVSINLDLNTGGEAASRGRELAGSSSGV